MVPVDIQIYGAILGVVIIIATVAFWLEERHHKISKFLDRLIDFFIDSLRF